MTPSKAAQQILQHANAAGLSPRDWADKFNKFNPKLHTQRGPMTAPLSPETTAILAAIQGYGPNAPEIAAQALRAMVFLGCSRMPLDRDQLHQISEELDL